MKGEEKEETNQTPSNQAAHIQVDMPPAADSSATCALYTDSPVPRAASALLAGLSAGKRSCGGGVPSQSVHGLEGGMMMTDLISGSVNFPTSSVFFRRGNNCGFRFEIPNR
ncbi:MAG: hypothetical protein HC774_06160 [Sphingomonadales bacterium]|nr:hypothetical protein [Sphingomonadales bacterium]